MNRDTARGQEARLACKECEKALVPVFVEKGHSSAQQSDSGAHTLQKRIHSARLATRVETMGECHGGGDQASRQSVSSTCESPCEERSDDDAGRCDEQSRRNGVMEE